METEKKKRQRGSNFTAREYLTLLEIIAKYKNIVENKKTDAVSSEQKSSAWKKITMEFNSASPEFTSRSIESIKKFYDNKKKDIRKLKAEEKMETVLTGGGPPVKPKCDDLLLSLIDPLTVVGGENTYDSDSMAVTLINNNENTEFTYQNENIDENMLIEPETCKSSQSEESSHSVSVCNENINPSVTKDWKKYTICDIQTAKNSALERPNPNISTTSLKDYPSSTSSAFKKANKVILQDSDSPSTIPKRKRILFPEGDQLQW